MFLTRLVGRIISNLCQYASALYAAALNVVASSAVIISLGLMSLNDGNVAKMSKHNI